MMFTAEFQVRRKPSGWLQNGISQMMRFRKRNHSNLHSSQLNKGETLHHFSVCIVAMNVMSYQRHGFCLIVSRLRSRNDNDQATNTTLRKEKVGDRSYSSMCKEYKQVFTCWSDLTSSIDFDGSSIGTKLPVKDSCDADGS